MTQEDAVRAALKGLSETDLKANLILCCMRGESNVMPIMKRLSLPRNTWLKTGE